MINNDNGNWNVAVGYESLGGNTSGTDNVAVGRASLYSNTTGQNNSVLGARAMSFNETGILNTACGTQALQDNVSGSRNSAFGFRANVGAGDLTDATAIGADAIVDASNKVRIGSGYVTSIGGQVGWTIYSDVRVKDRVKENVPGLKFINALKPVTFHYNIAKQNKLMGIESKIESRDRSEIEEIPFTGFLAQDVDAAAQRIGYNFSGIDRTGKIMGLRYADFVVPIVKAVQELSDKVETMNAPAVADQVKMTALENQVNDQKQIIGDQQKQIDDLNSNWIKCSIS
ncbi:MAG: tail fiber domain-containing protein [Saprospiraceae bacterium]|nr:tail fiber domain-containing protein [Saprospiraceae bacterium]